MRLVRAGVRGGARGFVALGLGGALLLGCGREAAAPQLLTVDEIAPLVLSEGEALEIRGAGFAPKRSARVTFRGALHRPGAEADAAWVASADGVAESAQRLRVAVPEALRARFCGPAGSAVHATFRGEVDVAFEPLTPGALPVRGTLAGVVLDVYPVGAYPVEAQRAEATRALEAMGVTLAGEAADEGGSLLVASVEPEGPAEAAGIVAGDRLESLDGVRLLDAADALPSGRHPYAVVGVRRPEPSDTFERQVPLRSFRRRRGSAEFGAAGALLSLAAGALLFAASPLARTLTWRASAPRRPGGWRPALPPGAFGLSALVAGAFSALALAGSGGGAGAEALSPLALGAALATGLPAGGVGGEGGWLRRAWALLKRAVLGVVPVAAAWACASALAGSIWVADVVNVQGGWPWQWAAFASPLGLLLAALFVSPALFKVERPRAATAVATAAMKAATTATAMKAATATVTATVAKAATGSRREWALG
ncbi:MAG TPA: PDZ domain-containing protein, partial [Polyangiaceae bacterium]|nr:PDZ domain-containing protein [Polyangiaceae bacterium]